MTSFFWKCAFFVEIWWFFWKIYKFYPWSTLRHFRRIRKNDAPFLKMCVFSQNSQTISIFCRNEQGTPAKIGVGHFILDNLTHAYHGRITYPFCKAALYECLEAGRVITCRIDEQIPLHPKCRDSDQDSHACVIAYTPQLRKLILKTVFTHHQN